MRVYSECTKFWGGVGCVIRIIGLIRIENNLVFSREIKVLNIVFTLFPRITTGQFDSWSSVRSESNSTLDSGNRALSTQSIKNTIASTAGK